MFEQIKKSIKDIRKDLVIADVVILILGLVMVIFPGQSSKVICVAIGLSLLFWGVITTVDYFLSGKTYFFGTFTLVRGVITTVFGVYFLAKPQVLASFLTIVLGLILLFAGVVKLQYGISLKKMGQQGMWPQIIAAAVVVAILGVITFVNPFAMSKTFMLFVGIAFLADAVWDMITVITLSKAIKEVADDGEFYPKADESDIPDEN